MLLLLSGITPPPFTLFLFKAILYESFNDHRKVIAPIHGKNRTDIKIGFHFEEFMDELIAKVTKI